MKTLISVCVFCLSLSSYATGGYGFVCHAKDQNGNEKLLEFYYDDYVGFVEKNGDSVPLYDEKLACGLKKSSETNCKMEMKYKVNGDAIFSSRCTFKNKPIKEMNGNLVWNAAERLGFFTCGVLPSRELVLEKCAEIGPH